MFEKTHLLIEKLYLAIITSNDMLECKQISMSEPEKIGRSQSPQSWTKKSIITPEKNGFSQSPESCTEKKSIIGLFIILKISFGRRRDRKMCIISYK